VQTVRISPLAFGEFSRRSDLLFEKRLASFLKTNVPSRILRTSNINVDCRGIIDSANRNGLQTEALIVAYAYISSIVGKPLADVDGDFIRFLNSQGDDDIRLLLLEERALAYQLVAGII
jgi:hypothetical protein